MNQNQADQSLRSELFNRIAAEVPAIILPTGPFGEQIKGNAAIAYLVELLIPYVQTKQQEAREEFAEKVKTGLITTTGENHEDFGPTWRTRMIDRALATYHQPNQPEQ